MLFYVTDVALLVSLFETAELLIRHSLEDFAEEISPAPSTLREIAFTYITRTRFKIQEPVSDRGCLLV